MMTDLHVDGYYQNIEVYKIPLIVTVRICTVPTRHVHISELCGTIRDVWIGF